jgi:hypothetical protein
MMLSLKVWTWSLACWAAISFLVCVAYGLVAPPSLHMARALEVLLPGFRWLHPVGFLIGLVESSLYGAYAALLFVPLHNFFHGRLQPAGAAARRVE